MMSLTFGLFTPVSGSGPLGPLVVYLARVFIFLSKISPRSMNLLIHEPLPTQYGIFKVLRAHGYSAYQS